MSRRKEAAVLLASWNKLYTNMLLQHHEIFMSDRWTANDLICCVTILLTLKLKARSGHVDMRSDKSTDEAVVLHLLSRNSRSWSFSNITLQMANTSSWKRARRTTKDKFSKHPLHIKIFLQRMSFQHPIQTSLKHNKMYFLMCQMKKNILRQWNKRE